MRAKAPKLHHLTTAIHEGYGQGRGDNYRTFLPVRKGRSSKVSFQHLVHLPVRRPNVHLMSKLEYRIALQACWLQPLELREGLPLWPFAHPHPNRGWSPELDARLTRMPGLYDLACEAGIDHGVYVGTKLPYVATTDLVFLVRVGGECFLETFQAVAQGVHRRRSGRGGDRRDEDRLRQARYAMMSLAFFPRPMPGELDIGHVARAQLMCGYRSLPAFLNALGAPRSQAGDLRICGRWGPTVVVCVATATGQTAIEYARAHTLLPHAGAFAMHASNAPRSESVNLALLGVRQSFHKRALRYCPECAREQREAHGMSFWLREHQLPGMDWCLRHRVLLHEAPRGAFEAQPGEQFAGRRTDAEENGFESPLVGSYLAAALQMLRNPRPLPTELVIGAIKEEFRQAGIRHAVNYHRAVSSILLRRAPRRWLARLLKAAQVSPQHVTVGVHRRTSVPIIAPLLASLAFPRGDVERLFDVARYEHGANQGPSSEPHMLLN